MYFSPREPRAVPTCRCSRRSGWRTPKGFPPLCRCRQGIVQAFDDRRPARASPGQGYVTPASAEAPEARLALSDFGGGMSSTDSGTAGSGQDGSAAAAGNNARKATKARHAQLRFALTRCPQGTPSPQDALACGFFATSRRCGGVALPLTPNNRASSLILFLPSIESSPRTFITC